MPRFIFLRLLMISLSLWAIQVTAATQQSNPTQANKTIRQLYHGLNHKPTLDMAARITLISAKFLDKPYLLGALGEGAEGDYDQWPLYRTDAFDCETYVDTVLALARANNLPQFKQSINLIRYKDGQVAFTQRNHFTCLDWNKNNQRQGFVKDITSTIRNKDKHSVTRYARALIDKPSWYTHMTEGSIRLNKVTEKEKAQRLKLLQRESDHLAQATSTIPYIPLTALFDSNGIANQYLFNQIPNAAIIEIIRPNWDLTKEIGTHLNVSHLGFAIWKHGVLFFRQASSNYRKVVDVPLIDYLRDTLKSPTIKGINVQIVLPIK